MSDPGSYPGVRLLRGARIARRAGRLHRGQPLLRPVAPGEPRRTPRRGFTLVEMMVAILLIGVGLMGLAALSTTVARCKRPQRLAHCGQLARSGADGALPNRRVRGNRFGQ